MLRVSSSMLMILCSDMRHAAVIILILSHCAFSELAHEVVRFVGCFDNSSTEVLFKYDAEEVLYVDFERQELVYTVPRLIVLDPSEMFEGLRVYIDAVKGKRVCPAALAFFTMEEKNPPEEQDPPESILYPAEDVQPGVENSLICFMNHFYPPFIEVSWTKNGRPVTEGVSISRYYANDDQTFHQFSTLTFTPMEGDIYSCTVEHSALERPKTRFWEPEFSHQSQGPDIFCGVGLTLCFLGVTAGTILIVKGHYRC